MVAIVSPGSAPIQRLIREGKKKGVTIDITSGRRTKCAIFTDAGAIILIAITPEAIAGRVATLRSGPARLAGGRAGQAQGE